MVIQTWRLAWLAACILICTALHAAHGLPNESPAVYSSYKDCLAANMPLLRASCALTRATSTFNAATPGQVWGPDLTPNLSGAQVLRLLLSCPTDMDASTDKQQAVRVLLATGSPPELVEALELYMQQTLLPMLTEQPQSAEDLYSSIMNSSSPSGQGTHHVWMVPESAVGDGVATGAFQDLSSLVGTDARLVWDDVFPSMKASRAEYSSKIAGLPWSTSVLSLFYRKDMFMRYNWTVPRTWQELVNVTAAVNGTQGMHGFCSGWGTCHSTAHALFRSILASHHQARGLHDHWLIDPQSMDMLTDSPAVEEAFRIIKELYRYSAPDMLPSTASCSYEGYSFIKSKCIMSISFNELFKWASHTSQAQVAGSVQGNLGVAMLPGSNLVLDRPTNTLVPCNLARCPYATRFLTNSSNRILWVNRSPTYETSLVTINRFKPVNHEFFAWMVASLVASPVLNDRLVFDPSAAVFPSRASQLITTRWAAAGFQFNDSKEYTDAMAYTFKHPNANQPLRFPGAQQLNRATSQVLALLLQPDTPTQQLTDLALQYKTLMAAAVDTAAALRFAFNKTSFWDSLNMVARTSGPLVDSISKSSDDNDDSSASSGPSPALMAGAILVPIGVIAICFKLINVRRSLLSQAFRKSYPGRGSMTTLLITDIEGSTALWEELSAEVMDVSAKLHNACIRRLASEMRGYESATEGDAFVIAFHTPQAALQCCILAQKALLKLAWPQELLAMGCAQEVWVRRARKTELKTSKLDSPFSSNDDKPSKLPSSPRKKVMFQGADAFEHRPATPTKAGQASITSASHSSGGLDKQGSSVGHQELSRTSPQVEIIWSIGTGVLEEADPGGLPCMRPSVFGGQVLAPGLAALQTANYSQELVASWEVVSAGEPRAVLAYRGLRVRFAMHSGLSNEADIKYSKHMGRYHYCGLLRGIAGAIASAIHGGQIMISGTTAALLDPQRVGQPCLLPQECKLFHMGDHQLHEVPGQVFELIQVVPQCLTSRMALRQEQLKTLQCVLPGVLAAPIPSPAAPACPTLVVLRVTDLDALIVWDRFRLIDALHALLGCARGTLSRWGGVVSKDGVSLAIRRAMVAPGLVPTQCSCTPGQLVVALSDARSALEYALSLRQQLLTLEWDSGLLAHDLCCIRETSASSSVQQMHTGGEMNATSAGMISPYALYKQVPIRNPSGAGISKGLMFNPMAPSFSTKVHTAESAVSSPRLSTVGSLGDPELGVSTSSLDSPRKMSVSRLLAPSLQNLAGCFPAPLLCGLRTKIVLMCGQMSMQVDEAATGRAVYSGKAVKQLPVLLSAAKAGDVMISPQVAKLLVQAGMPLVHSSGGSTAAAHRLATAESPGRQHSSVTD